MKIILLGKPGAGKGTQAELLSNWFKIPIISMGEILRNIERRKTKLGKLIGSYINKGRLIPDWIATNIVKKEIRGKKGYILDGYPRNINQAKEFEGFERIDYVIDIYVPDSIIVKRLSARRECVCGMSYNLLTNPPKKDLICDVCERKLYRRKDDNPKTIKRRLIVYKKRTKPLIDFYKRKGVLIRVNGNLPIKKTFNQIIKNLKQ